MHKGWSWPRSKNDDLKWSFFSHQANKLSTAPIVVEKVHAHGTLAGGGAKL